jgi:membrane-associated phospholipid phosphatase
MDEPKKTEIVYLLPGAILVPRRPCYFSVGWRKRCSRQTHSNSMHSCGQPSIGSLRRPLPASCKKISDLGSVAVVATLGLLATVLCYYYHRQRAATLLVITMAGAAGLDLMLKHAFHRARPIPYFGTSPSSYSFPSGHALGSLCFYSALAAILSARTRKRAARLCIWTTAVLLIGMMGFSRIYLGVHYPSDVIAGCCAAIVWVGAVGITDKILKNRPDDGRGREQLTGTFKSQ